MTSFDTQNIRPQKPEALDCGSLLPLSARQPAAAKGLFVFVFLFTSTVPFAQDKPAPAPNVIDGVKGVKQEAVSSVKNQAPPTVVPVTPPPVVPATPPPPPTNNPPPTPVNKVDGVQAKGREAVQPVPPPPPLGSATQVDANAVGAVSSIRAVKGVQGIIPPKQLNLEAALLIKQDANTPAGTGAEQGGKGKAAAAALLTAPGARVPAKPLPGVDGRAALQEFEKQTTPGS